MSMLTRVCVVSWLGVAAVSAFVGLTPRPAYGSASSCSSQACPRGLNSSCSTKYLDSVCAFRNPRTLHCKCAAPSGSCSCS